MTLRETSSYNSLGVPLPPKVCHRADPDVVVEQGNHALRSPASTTAPLQPIVIFHAPVRSWPQLDNKVAKGGAAYARNLELPESVGDAWRELHDLRTRGELRRWYDEQVPDAGARRSGIDDGRFVVDHRLAHFLARARWEPPFASPSTPPGTVVGRAVVGRAAVSGPAPEDAPAPPPRARAPVWRRGVGRLRRGRHERKAQ
jgi:hypothetical protein